ncbi:1-acyl-sn-glycerol-3-phosphate acyltransferase alpha [Sitophilus oryzae]|uniref:1-acylglycerol-3-phosphate O-acyltransferase n=1 Tax=Sitophilus oryzae TaxID=7048 RepID=A0A6J2Y4L8_SITOR|nr:1-acyl-sn-glycerol-3-phosphate acyltransferase alpha [Sitophilus oryzae]
MWPTMGRCTVIAKSQLFWAWPFGLAAWLAGLVFIPRVRKEKAKQVLNEAVEKITRDKTKLWIFPEGTRRNTGEIHEFKKGAFHAAISAQLPILPVVFSRYYFLDKPTKRFDQGVVIIETLEPISTKGKTLEDLESLMEETREKMTKTFKKLNSELMSNNNSHQLLK